MAITIDELELEIIDNSGSVVDGLERLQAVLNNFKSVAGLNKSAKQIESFAASVNKLGSMGKLRELANALTAIGAVPKASISSSLGNQITAISAAVAGIDAGSLGKIKLLQESLSPLTSLGKPQLGSFITQLKKLPAVALELEKIDMNRFAASLQKVTTVLAPLANEMNKISLGFSALPSKIQRVISSNERLAMSNGKTGKSFGAMGTGISSLQAKFGIYYMLAKRAADVMGGWVSESNAYVENLNLFTVSMGKYANKSLKYAESVQSVMGIDMSEWIRNQGIFMQIGTGFGVVADKAAIMSKGLTQIAYDMSSYFNADITTALEKVQSGFAGELEPLRRWGYALDQATLQQLAYKNGITQSINTMTQAQKSQLRYVAIMEQSKNVMGDMARTLGTPANAVRILGQQITQLTRALGNMFIPILIKIVPYVQAFVMVLTDAAQAIANFFGFELPTIDYSGIGGLSSGAVDAEEALGGAAKAAKKLKDYTAGFDELNILSKDTSASGGAGGGGGGISGGGDLGLDLKDYDFLGGAKGKIDEIKKSMEQFFGAFKKNPVIKWLGDTLKFMWEKGVKPLGSWIIKNPNKVADFLVGIGVAIATYKLVNTIANVAKALSGTKGLASGLKVLSGMAGTPKILTGLAAILTNPWALAIAAVAGGIALVAISISKAKEEAINADLARRFGDISLSMEEVKDIADRLTSSDLTVKIDLYYSENAKLEDIKNSIKGNVEELNKQQWKISIGMQLNESEQSEYKATIDSFITNAQTYVTQKRYTMTIAIDALLSGTNTGVELQNFVDTYMAQSQAKLDGLGKELRDTVNNAFADGVVDEREMAAIINLQKEMQEIVSKVADAEYNAQMTALLMDFDSTSITFESFQGVMAEAQKNIEEQLQGLDGVRVQNIKIAQLKFQEDGDKTAFDAAMQQIESEFKTKQLNLHFETFDFGMDVLTKAYGDELFSKIPELSQTTIKTISGAFDTARKDPSGFNTAGFVTDVGFSLQQEFSKLSPEVQGSFKKVLECMKPTYDQMREIKSQCEKAGIAVPEGVSKGLKDITMLSAMTGDEAALFDLLGTTIKADPKKQELFNAVNALGMEIPKGLADQITFGSTSVSDAAALMASGALTGAQNQLTADKEGWKEWTLWPWNWFKEANEIESPSKKFSVLGGYLSDGLMDGINGKKKGLFSEIGTWASGIIGKVKGVFGIHSPSKLFRDEIGMNLGLGLAEGLSLSTKEVIASAQAISNNIQGAFEGITMPHLTLSAYATGGFPEDGLFMANHGEMVGKFSNGRTAVANNDQIVQGIEAGVYRAVTAAMSGKQGGEASFNLFLDGKQITASVEKTQRERGATIMPGGAIFSV